ncbi:hypothetical protein L596_020637 [Steinernema carpocapsae]|uniref:7TM GPCR serpentine receptor class x (Srx) domain-containing protein n=1 Tax=Steinernema carpocapsae TaxID=34508 RepID=A0A4U5MUB9_STECR|nr:hypothetical protein L596_020637 [Steinernema carpocapsae]
MNMATIPFCNPNRTLVDLHTPIAFSTQYIFIGILYFSTFVVFDATQVLCFLAICHKKHLQYPCYKLMFFVSFLDMVNLFDAIGAPGILSFFRIDHCQHGNIVGIFSRFLMVAWYAYCAASMILATNRCLEFTYAPLAHALFDGHKAWFWIIPICTYALVVEFTTPNAFYFYVPDAGVFNLQTLNKDPTSYNHVANNLTKFAFVTVAYFVMWCFMKLKINGMQTTQMSAAEKKLSIQALLVGVFAGFSTVGYIAIEYLPFHNVPMIGLVGSYLWASVHVASAVIYITMNKSIRMTVLEMLNLKKPAKLSVISIRTVTALRM